MGKQAKTVSSSLAAAMHLPDPARLLIQDAWLLWHGEVVCYCCVQWLQELEKGRWGGERSGGTGERVGKGGRRDVGETELAQVRG